MELLAEHGLTGSADIRAEPISLTTRFHVGEAAAAALAATGVVVEALDPRSRRAQPIVATRHAEATLLSFALQQFTDPTRAPATRLAPEARSAVAGFHGTSDGRIVYLHAGFPHNTTGLLRLLDVPDDRDAVRKRVAEWEALDLERAIARHGLCGAMVRPPEEWDACAAGRLLATRPIVDIVQIGEAPPRPLRGDARVLDGVRVLDLTRVLAGPTCARTLAMYGADVLAVSAERLPSIPAFVADTGLGKRAAFLDLVEPRDKAQLEALLEDADVFSQGYRTGALDRLGFGPMDAARLKPGIIYVSINCYGHEGEWRTRPGWEQLAQTVTGMAHVHGVDRNGSSGGPELLPAAVNDYTTGYLAALGVIVALSRRATDGGSYWVRVSLARTAMWVRSLGLRTQLPSVVPLDEGELSRLRVQVETAWGPLSHVKAPVVIENRDIGWTRPPCPLGTHPPRW
jgi:crotonobetainyl-CoA:carnitine CoA-transferase CaiB-like acyl-CoA transferase